MWSAVIQRSILLLVRPVAARHSSRPTLVLGQCSSAGVGLPPRRWRMGQTGRGVRWRARETRCGRTTRTTCEAFQHPARWHRLLGRVHKKGHRCHTKAHHTSQACASRDDKSSRPPGAAFGWQSTPWWRQTIRSPAPRSSPRRTSRRRCSRRAGSSRTLSTAPWKAPSRRASTTRAATPSPRRPPRSCSARARRGTASRRGPGCCGRPTPRRTNATPCCAPATRT